MLQPFRWSKAVEHRTIHEIPADRPVYVLSDIHLGDGTAGDIFMGKDRALLDFLREARDEGANIVVAGDAVDFSQAWDLTSILRVHGKILGAFSELGSAGRLWYILGNHDRDFLTIADNGQGFAVDGHRGPGHQGLSNMRGRAVGLGGRFEVESAPQDGTRIIVRVPLRPGGDWGSADEAGWPTDASDRGLETIREDART